MPKGPKGGRHRYPTGGDAPVIWIGTVAAFGLILSGLFIGTERTTVAMTDVPTALTVASEPR